MRRDREPDDVVPPEELARTYWHSQLSEFDQIAAKRAYQGDARSPRDPWIVRTWLRMRIEEGRMSEQEAYRVLGAHCMRYARYLSGRLGQDPKLVQLVYSTDVNLYYMLATGFEQLSGSVPSNSRMEVWQK